MGPYSKEFTMPNNHSSSTNPSNVAVNEDFDMMINGLIKVESAASKPATRPIGKLTIHPTQQSSLALGTYDKQHAPKGFCVEIDPDPNPDHSVVTRILSTGSMREYTLTLVAANFGNTTANVTVRHL
jgi:hypothetical protein